MPPTGKSASSEKTSVAYVGRDGIESFPCQHRYFRVLASSAKLTHDRQIIEKIIEILIYFGLISLP